mmetsp:Transcript_153892/g.286818  ORF Transcript_153892/g.286818 Transcript_153892/m.286818 type:complete len:146 (-) Transcript_153892:210-647(-)
MCPPDNFPCRQSAQIKTEVVLDVVWHAGNGNVHKLFRSCTQFLRRSSDKADTFSQCAPLNLLKVRHLHGSQWSPFATSTMVLGSLPALLAMAEADHTLRVSVAASCSPMLELRESSWYLPHARTVAFALAANFAFQWARMQLARK